MNLIIGSFKKHEIGKILDYVVGPDYKEIRQPFMVKRECTAQEWSNQESIKHLNIIPPPGAYFYEVITD